MRLISILITYIMYIVEMAKESNLRLKGDNKVPLPARVKRSIFERINDYAEENGLIRNSVIEEALEDFLDKKDREKKKS